MGLRVVAQLRSGGPAEKIVVGAGRILPVLEGVRAEQATSLFLTCGTFYHAPKDRAKLQASDQLGRTLSGSGFAASVPRVPLNLVLLKGGQIVGVVWEAAVDRDPEAMRDCIGEMLEWIADGSLTTLPLTSYPLSEGGKAFAALRNRQPAGRLS